MLSQNFPTLFGQKENRMKKVDKVHDSKNSFSSKHNLKCVSQDDWHFSMPVSNWMKNPRVRNFEVFFQNLHYFMIIVGIADLYGNFANTKKLSCEV